MLFQILLILFAVFAIWRTIGQYKKQKVTVRWTAIWLVVWIGLIVVAMIPQQTDILANVLGIETGAAMFTYAAIVILSYGMYRLLIRAEKHHRELTELVRKIAIMEAEKN
jgi:hypothetical protein